MTKQLTIACLILALSVMSCNALAAPTPTPTAIATAAATAGATTLPTATLASADTPTAGPTGAPTDTALPAATDTPAASPTPGIAYMTYQDFAIVPGSLTIKAGTKVVFLIKGGFGSFHQPYSSHPNNTDLSGLFEAPALLGDGASFSFTFTQAGAYTVRCGYHPNDMVASIEVTP